MKKPVEFVGLSCAFGSCAWYFGCAILSGGTELWYWEPNPVLYSVELIMAAYAILVIAVRTIEILRSATSPHALQSKFSHG